MKKVLVVAAHPDDEVLGAGGTLAKHYQEGDIIYCIILGTGIASRDINQLSKEREIEELRKQAKKCGKIIGFKEIKFYDLQDNSFDIIPLLEIIKILEKEIDRVKPEIIYTHFYGDLNIDHRLTFEAVQTACRPVKESSVKQLITFETPSSTEWRTKELFNPNLYVDISETFSKKLEAVENYKGELRAYPFPRSLEGLKILAQKRGMESGLRFAEAFQIIRRIE